MAERDQVREIRKPVDEGFFAQFQGKAQVLFSFVAVGKAVLERWFRFEVSKLQPQAPSDNFNGVGEVDVERPPDVARIVVHVPPPTPLDMERLAFVKGSK
jgi:hypothetical protein